MAKVQMPDVTERDQNISWEQSDEKETVSTGTGECYTYHRALCH